MDAQDKKRLFVAARKETFPMKKRTA